MSRNALRPLCRQFSGFEEALDMLRRRDDVSFADTSNSCVSLSFGGHTYTALVTIFAVPLVAEFGVRQVTAELFVEYEQRDFSSLESLPCAARASLCSVTFRSQWWCSRGSCYKPRQERNSHRAIDIIVRYSISSLVFFDSNKRTATHHAANLRGSEWVWAPSLRRTTLFLHQK